MGRRKKGAKLVETQSGKKGRVTGELFGKLQIELVDDDLNQILDNKGNPSRVLARPETVKILGFID